MTRYAFISDIHGNQPALDSVLNFIMRNLKIPRQNIRCLGDVVGYYPYPNQCVEMINDLEIWTLKGNHDQACADDIDHKIYFKGWGVQAKIPVLYTRKQLKPKNKEFLQGLEFIVHEKGFGWAHSNPINPEDFYMYIPEDMVKGDPIPTVNASQLFKAVQEPVFFVAHAHHPSITILPPENPDNYGIIMDDQDMYKPYTLDPDKKTIINVGAVGQPRDFDPRACFVVYDDEVKHDGEVIKTVQFFRVKYEDMESVQELTRKTFPEKVKINAKKGVVKEVVLGHYLADRLGKGI